MSAATVNPVGTAVRSLLDHLHAMPRDVYSLFHVALFQQLSDLANALVGRVFIGLDTAIGESVDRFDASLGNLLRIRFVVSIGSLRVGELLRSEEHTSELQSRRTLVCRLLLEQQNRHTL